MIVIPMAGLSQRFIKAGYRVPKYILELQGKTVFEWSVLSFKNYFKKEKFLFVIRKDNNSLDFIREKINKVGIKNYEIISIIQSEGQADTVYQALKQTQFSLKDELLIFNIDTFRFNFTFFSKRSLYRGYLEVFKGKGDNWSFVLPNNKEEYLVEKTTEKIPISNLCCTGIYYFSLIQDFTEAYESQLTVSLRDLEGKERYVAPLYNHLIKNGLPVAYHLIKAKEVIFCGIPSEYESLQYVDLNKLA